jgi:predicted GIY-YIG superfamily endonuclease
MPWFTYIAECADGTYYAGIATDVDRRMAEHNSGTGAKYTRSRTPVTCVWYEEHPDRSSASKRECEIKAMSRARKERLVAEGEKQAK